MRAIKKAARGTAAAATPVVSDWTDSPAVGKARAEMQVESAGRRGRGRQECGGKGGGDGEAKAQFQAAERRSEFRAESGWFRRSHCRGTRREK